MAEPQLQITDIPDEPPSLDIQMTKEARSSSTDIAPWRRTTMNVLESTVPPAAAIVGGTLGASAGATTGPAAVVASPAAAIKGAGFGGALGTAAVEAVRPFITGESKGPVEIFKDSIFTGLMSAVGEGITPIAQKGLEKASRYVSRPFRAAAELADPYIQRTRDILHEFGSQLKGASSDLSFGQMIGETSGIIPTLESIATNSLLGTKRAGRFFAGQQKAIQAYADDIINGLGGQISRREAAQLLTRTVEDRYSASIPIRRAMYNAAKVLNGGKLNRDGVVVGGNMIDTKEIVRIFNKRGARADYQYIANRLFDEGTEELGSVMATKAGQTWTAKVPLDKAITLRSSLNEIVRSKGPNEPEGRTANFLLSRIKEAINTGITPEARRALAGADGFTRDIEQSFNNRWVKGLISQLKDEPALLTSALLRPNRPDRINRLIDIVGKDFYDSNIRPALVKDIVDSTIDATTGRLDGNALIQRLAPSIGAQSRGLGDTAQAAFGTDTTQKLIDLGHALRLAETRSTGPGAVWIRLAQGGAFGALAVQSAAKPIEMITGYDVRVPGATGTATFVIMAPWALSKLLVNPRGIQLMTDGLQATTRNALARSVSQMSSFVGGNKLIEKTGLREVPTR